MQREKMVYMAVKDSSQEDEDISKHTKKHFCFSYCLYTHITIILKDILNYFLKDSSA